MDPDREPMPPPRPPRPSRLNPETTVRGFERPKWVTALFVVAVAVVHLALGYAFIDLAQKDPMDRGPVVVDIIVETCGGPLVPVADITPPRIVGGGKIPALASELGLSGTVRLQVSVNAKGQAVSTCLERRGSDQLDAMLAGEAMTWRYAPAMRGNAAIAGTLRFEARLDPPPVTTADTP
jgi:hypothetical protein